MAAWLAWGAGFRLEQPITALIHSAERFGQGDYTRPVDIVRHDELGDLQRIGITNHLLPQIWRESLADRDEE